MSDKTVARPAQQMAVVLMAATLLSALSSGRTIVAPLLLGYAEEAQSFPGAVLGLFWKRANQAEVSTGLMIGIAAVTTFVSLLSPS